MEHSNDRNDDGDATVSTSFGAQAGYDGRNEENHPTVAEATEGKSHNDLLG